MVKAVPSLQAAHGCAGRGHPQLEVHVGCGGRRPHTHSSVDPRQLPTKGRVSLNGAELLARDGTARRAWELLPSPSDTTHTPRAKLQPAPKVTPQSPGPQLLHSFCKAQSLLQRSAEGGRVHRLQQQQEQSCFQEPNGTNFHEICICTQTRRGLYVWFRTKCFPWHQRPERRSLSLQGRGWPGTSSTV